MKVKAHLNRKDPIIDTSENVIEYVKKLSDKDFRSLMNSLLSDRSFIADNVELMYESKGVRHCILALNEQNGDGILIDSSGSNYARYTAFLPHIKIAIDKDAKENSLTKVNLYERSAIIDECQSNWSLKEFEEYPYDEYPYNFSKIETAEELKKELCSGGYCIRTAFMYEDLAFVQQVDGGDEWLTMKQNGDKFETFESISFYAMHKRGGDEVVYDEIDRCLNYKFEQNQEMSMG